MKKSQSSNRHRARELAAQLLYSLFTRPDQDIAECLDVFTSEDGFAFEESSEVKKYLAFLAEGVWSRRFEIDDMMRRTVTGWRPERMVAVDRVVLQMAIFEGFLGKTAPLSVAISEAIELACAFGTEDSGKFVNGVLGKLARSIDGGDKPSAESVPRGDDNAVAPSETSADR